MNVHAFIKISKGRTYTHDLAMAANGLHMELPSSKQGLVEEENAAFRLGDCIFADLFLIGAATP